LLPEPPTAVKVTEAPEQTVDEDALILVGAVAGDETLTVNVTPEVLEHGDDCVRLTQYVVVEEGETVKVDEVCPLIMLDPTDDPVPH
jgi:hypothetical protein